jgi:hypothetical protein
LPLLALLNTCLDTFKSRLKCEHCGAQDVHVTGATGVEMGCVRDMYEHFDI